MKAIKRKTQLQAQISTASLPDIVFLLLFFFMVTAVIRQDKQLVKYQVPKAKYLTKEERKILIRELQLGVPANRAFGAVPLITDGRKFLRIDDIAQWAEQERASIPEQYKDQMIVVIKADQAVEMGQISDVQQELRKVNARKVLYRSLDKPGE